MKKIDKILIIVSFISILIICGLTIPLVEYDVGECNKAIIEPKLENNKSNLISLNESDPITITFYTFRLPAGPYEIIDDSVGGCLKLKVPILVKLYWNLK